jgi:hypothetical protein
LSPLAYYVAVVGDYGGRASGDELHGRDDGRRLRDYGHVAATSWPIAPVYWLMAAFYGLEEKDDCQSSGHYALNVVGFVD